MDLQILKVEVSEQIAMVTRVESPEVSAMLQRDLVEAFRNISVIDLGLVLRTIDAVLDQVRLAIRFMTLFVLQQLRVQRSLPGKIRSECWREP